MSERAQARVREMAAEYGIAGSQDAVVEVAVDRLFREVQAEAEAMQWAVAANDAEFRRESADLGRAFSDLETWPA